MKKKLLLSVLLTLTLCSCGKTDSSEDSFNMPITSTSYYDLEYYIENARYELETMCVYAWGRIDDEILTDYIYQFYEQENGYLDSIVDIYEASESINTIKSHEAEYIRTVFGVELNNRIDERANPVIETINIPDAKKEVIEFVNETKNRIINGGLGFYDTYNQYDMFMWEFEPKVINIVWSHGGNWDPEDPGTGTDSPWQKQIDELWNYVDELAYEIQEYCELDVVDYVMELIAQFDECQSGHEANNLLYNLKWEVYDEALLQLKNSLCDLYSAFIRYVNESISDYNMKKSIIEHEEDAKIEIFKAESLESAIIEYENFVYDSKDIIWANYQNLAIGFLDEMLKHYMNELEGNQAKLLELAKTYSLYAERINKICCELEYLEDLVNEILDSFADYGEELIRS